MAEFKYTTKDLQRIAKGKGGISLSKNYLGMKAKHKWKCAKGHIWSATVDSVKRITWCPECSKKTMGGKRLTLGEMKDLAKSRNGNCLSKKYINSSKTLKWKCENGHIWEASPSSIKHGSWCKKCYYKNQAGTYHKKTIEDAKKIARIKGGECLSTKYINVKSKLIWKCKNGHIWETSYSSVQKHWCNICASVNRSKKQIKYNIQDMKELVRLRKGDCLSKKYISSATKLKWKCVDGHVWEATPANIRYGYWCPYCNKLVGETICRNYLENIFGEKFKKSKPFWLKNINGNIMELDGFCEKLKIAFEHQGRQHYEMNWFHKNGSDLRIRKKDDNLKSKLCKEKGIKLILIPEVGYKIAIENLYEYLIKELKNKNINIPQHNKMRFEKKTIFLSSKISELSLIAKERQGALLSKQYLGNHKKLRWKCSLGHEWEATPSKIKIGRWCPKCAGKLQRTLTEMKQVAEMKGGKCLSSKYINLKSKLRWQCKEGHKWNASPSSIIHVKSWCPKCAKIVQADRQRGNIETQREMARNRKGKCLSKIYVNARTKLKWKCEKGHIWEAVSDSIRRGRWCPCCAKKKYK